MARACYVLLSCPCLLENQRAATRLAMSTVENEFSTPPHKSEKNTQHYSAQVNRNTVNRGQYC